MVGFTDQYASKVAEITATATAVIHYVSRYVDWSTSMNFVVKLGAPGSGPAGGLLPSYPGDYWLASRNLFVSSALQEQIEGREITNNLNEPYNAGLTILPAQDGSLSNYGTPIWFGAGATYPNSTPPPGTHDFASIFLHEIVHSFGIRGGNFTNYQTYVQTAPDGRLYFNGPATTLANGGKPLELVPWQPDHYVPGPGGLMSDPIVYEGNTWTMDKITLSMLKDLGWSVRNMSELPQYEPIAEIPPTEVPVENSGLYEVSRFLNSVTGAHFYTANPVERDFLKAQGGVLVFEGNVFDSDATVATGIAVHRFFNTVTGTHFYTANEAETTAIQQNLPAFRYENIAYYAYDAPDLGRAALHRFYNENTGTHFFTASEQERMSVANNLPGMKYEGVAYYVDYA